MPNLARRPPNQQTSQNFRRQRVRPEQSSLLLKLHRASPNLLFRQTCQLYNKSSGPLRLQSANFKPRLCSSLSRHPSFFLHNPFSPHFHRSNFASYRQSTVYIDPSIIYAGEYHLDHLTLFRNCAVALARTQTLLSLCNPVDFTHLLT